MNRKGINKYTIVWLITCVIVLSLLWQMQGDARVINYSGIIRGGTQRVVKQGLQGVRDDELIDYLDEIIYDLQTGQGNYDLAYFRDKTYHTQLDQLTISWEKIKSYIANQPMNEEECKQLYSISEQHYEQAGEMVERAEHQSSMKFFCFVGVYLLAVLICIRTFILFDRNTKKETMEFILKDTLTGALTPRAFVEEATKIVEQDKNEQYVTIGFDIKNFKKINTIFGYKVGNKVLCDIANGLLEKDILTTRIMADMFFVLMKDSQNTIEELCAFLHTTLITYEINDRKVNNDMEFRFGGATVKESREMIKAAMERAYIAHKLARQGDVFSMWCDEKLLEHLEQQTYFEENLQKAITNKELQVYLQPQIDLNTKQVIGAESLVRWKLSTGEVLFPDSFIPLFEQKGLIHRLDYYMLEEVCIYLKQRMEVGNNLYSISVNFSRVTLDEFDFYQKIIDIVDQYQLPYYLIGIEVVETAINKMDQQTITLLKQLKSIGFKVSMDDFGAGYSSLNVLSNLPVHIVKLDRQFLWSVNKNSKMQSIMTSIVDMAHKIGLEVLCEGVEIKEHEVFLQSIGCDYAQGYYYGYPVSIIEYKH